MIEGLRRSYRSSGVAGVQNKSEAALGSDTKFIVLYLGPSGYQSELN
jgi:hypothetical protein